MFIQVHRGKVALENVKLFINNVYIPDYPANNVLVCNC